MSKSTLGFLLILILLGLHDFSIPEVKGFDIDLLKAEGYVAFIVNDVRPPDVPLPEPIACTCGGTKQIRTGDNRILPCPCDNCQCKKTGDLPTIADPPNIIEVPSKQILYFHADWCAPCQVFQRVEVPVLKGLGYDISDKVDAQIRMINTDLFPELYNKYAGIRENNQIRMRGIPLLVRIDNGLEYGFVDNRRIPAKAQSVITLWEKQ